jgi:NADH dehydrogenase FAD-containing subunit
MATVTGVDREQQRVLLDDGMAPVPYDYLILATGVHGSYFGHDEWAPLAPSVKTLAEAEALRRKIVGALEEAEQEDDDARRTALLTFVLVGAGPTGCELAGELAELFRRGLPSEYRRIDPRTARIILVEAGPRALPAFSESLSNGATEKLRRLGVEVRTGQAVQMVDAEGVVIAGERVQTKMVLWTAGVQASPAATWVGAEADRAGRAVVLPDLTMAGYPEVFIVGDTAHIENDGKPLPGVAQVALQSGKYAGHAILARVEHKPPPAPFKYFDKGNMATIAVTYAIMETRGMKLSGFIGKVGWAFIHVLYLGRLEGQFMLALQWVFGLVFGRTGARYIDTPVALAAAPPSTPPVEPVAQLQRP